MSVEQITKTVYKCHCEIEDCQYEWESDTIPKQCAKCHSFVWNREDRRKKVAIICSSCGKENKVRLSWRKNPVNCSCGAALDPSIYAAKTLEEKTA